MNKGLLIALTGVLMAGPVSVVHAVNPDNGPGCGLGKLAWADYKTPKNIAPQVMMATTNVTFGSQTFGSVSAPPAVPTTARSWPGSRRICSSPAPLTRCLKIWRGAAGSILRLWQR
jgi:hypothetical protein